MNTNKFIGCTMILIGTIIGAGILLMPILSAAAGFTWSAILTIVLWLVATVTGLCVLEVNLALPSHSCSFSSMAKHTMGNFGKVITWVSYLFLLYAVIVAYVIGGSNLIASTINFLFHIQIPNEVCAILFVLIFGTAVFWSTEVVDYFNRGLMSFKGISLVAALVFLTPYIDMNKLLAAQNTSQLSYLWLAVPTFVCAFGYHYVLPSIRIYIGDNPKQLRAIVIIATVVALIAYLWWLAVTFGTVPLRGDNSFLSIANDPKPPSGLIQLIITVANNPWVVSSINGFSNISMTTAILGVALGLFDFLADGLKRPNTRFGRLQTASLTFIPPLFFAIYCPGGFAIAINYASIPLAILTILLPVLMVFYLRKNGLQSPYRVKCSNAVLALISLVGIVSIVLAVMFILNLLPKLA